MEYKLEKNINDRISSVESERYRWRSFGSDVVFDKQKEKSIYQGQFVNPDTGRHDGTYPDDSWLDFLNLVERLLLEEKKSIRKKNEEELDAFEKRQNELRGYGWCEKCGSYCYGDCQ